MQRDFEKPKTVGTDAAELFPPQWEASCPFSSAPYRPHPDAARMVILSPWLPWILHFAFGHAVFAPELHGHSLASV